MWWIIGISVAIIALILILKLRTIHRQIELTNVCRDHIYMSFKLLNISDEGINPRVWSDPYLLGYAFGSTSIVLAFFGSKLPTVRKGMVSVNALHDLCGDRYAEVSDRMFRLHENLDPAFARGASDGGDVIALIFNQAGPELLADSEVQAAMREAPMTARALKGLGLYTYKGPLADTGGALMRRLMNRHKTAAGY